MTTNHIAVLIRLKWVLPLTNVVLASSWGEIIGEMISSDMATDSHNHSLALGDMAGD